MASGIKRIADRLEWVSGRHGILGGGSSSYPITLSDYTKKAMDFYFTSPSTDGVNNAESMLIHMTMAGAGAVGGRARFHTVATAKLGGWANALKAYFEFGAGGDITGLAAGACIEVKLPNANHAGTVAVLELELVDQASSGCGSGTSFIRCCGSGTMTAFDGAELAGGFLFDIAGFTPGDGLFIDDNGTPAAADGGIRIRLNGVVKYLLYADDAES